MPTKLVKDGDTIQVDLTTRKKDGNDEDLVIHNPPHRGKSQRDGHLTKTVILANTDILLLKTAVTARAERGRKAAVPIMGLAKCTKGIKGLNPISPKVNIHIIVDQL